MEADRVLHARQQFETDGFFLAAQPLFPDDVLASAVAGMDAVKTGDFDTGVPPSNNALYDPSRLCKINDAHLASTCIYRLLTNEALGEWAAAVTGARMVQIWASQLLIKPPGSEAAGHVGWHQDRQYWKFWRQPLGLFTAWIALIDVFAESGPMRFVRRSHHWGFLDQGDFFGSDHEALKADIQMPTGDIWEEADALLPAGGVSFHDCLTYHSSGANTSETPRCSVAVHMRTQEAEPVSGDTSYYISHLDDSAHCPVIYSG